MVNLNTPDTHGCINHTEEPTDEIANTLMLRDVEKFSLAGNTQVNYKADLAKIIEIPCLAACELLYDKNILTYWSSSNRDSPDKAEILIRFESLDEKNKKIANELSNSGIVLIGPYHDSWNTAEEYGPAVILRIETNPNMTVNEISDQLCDITNNFVQQDIKYNVYTPDYLLQYALFYGKHRTIFWFPSLEKTILGDEIKSPYSPQSEKDKLYDDIRYFLHSKNWNKLSWEDMKKIAAMIGRIYNEEDWFLYKDAETLRRHNNYKNNQSVG